MLNKPALWMLVILVMIATNASSQTQEQTGTIRVTVYVEGSETPVRGALISLLPVTNTVKKEEDLLDHLIALAQARGIATDDRLPADYADGSPRTNPVQSAFADQSGILVFRNVKFGKYEVRVVQRGASSIVTVDRDHPASSVTLRVSTPTAGK